MKANTDKFQFIVFKKHLIDDDIEICISNETIKPVSQVKLLGVTIDDKMTFDDHVANICAKAARQPNALCRIARFNPLWCRINLYNTFIASGFHNCNT